MLKSYRELDTIIVEAMAETAKMFEDFERTLLGNRAPQAFEEDENATDETEDLYIEGEDIEPEEPDDSAEDGSPVNEIADRAPGR